jgi:acyl-CoA synthetase (AMP-forming)/AMP-acid ligase II
MPISALARHRGTRSTDGIIHLVLQPESDIDAPALREYLKGKVSRFEQPRDIHIVGSIPRNPAGKVVRNELTT